MITLERLRHLATLTGLSLTTEQEQRYLKQFEGILGMIDQLQAVEIPECEIEREVSMEATDLPTGLIVSEHADRILEQVPLPVEQRQVRIDTSTDA